MQALSVLSMTQVRLYLNNYTFHGKKGASSAWPPTFPRRLWPCNMQHFERKPLDISRHSHPVKFSHFVHTLIVYSKPLYFLLKIFEGTTHFTPVKIGVMCQVSPAKVTPAKWQLMSYAECDCSGVKGGVFPKTDEGEIIGS